MLTTRERAIVNAFKRFPVMSIHTLSIYTNWAPLPSIRRSIQSLRRKGYVITATEPYTTRNRYALVSEPEVAMSLQRQESSHAAAR